jgi:homoserine kinase type II
MSYKTPVITSATSSSLEELKEAAGKFFKQIDGLYFTKCGGGVNNRVYYVEKQDEKIAVLRIYNNGFNTQRVFYEHAVLKSLENHQFSFKIPHLIRALNGETSVELSDGARACLFEMIPGTAAEIRDAFAIGKSTAELVTAMATLPAISDVEIKCPNPLYRNLFDSHSKMNSELFFHALKRCFNVVPSSQASLPSIPAHSLDHLSQIDVSPETLEAIQYLVDEVVRSETIIQQALAMHLPEQQIHADAHFDNILVDNGAVSGVLDFEFSSWDWRVMDCVVGLSKYVGMDDVEVSFRDWVSGYGSTSKLTKNEVSLIPDLIILRILSNVVYFVGRAVFGEDSFDAFTGRAAIYTKRIKYIHSHREHMLATLEKHVL